MAHQCYVAYEFRSTNYFQLWGQTLSNPVGLAAGFDKDGRAIDGIPDHLLVDLSFILVQAFSILDSVGWRLEASPRSPKYVWSHPSSNPSADRNQPGNPSPRVFHLPEDSALINRYGFPSQGHVSVLSRLRARLPVFPSTDEDHLASLRQGRLLAINLGKNKESHQESADDFILGVHAFAQYADVLVINVSSPNTPGLRCVRCHDSCPLFDVSLLSEVCNSGTCWCIYCAA